MRKFRSWKRAIKRGHLVLHNERLQNGDIISHLCIAKKRYGEPDINQKYMFLGVTKGDSREEVTE